MNPVLEAKYQWEDDIPFPVTKPGDPSLLGLEASGLGFLKGFLKGLRKGMLKGILKAIYKGIYKGFRGLRVEGLGFRV